MKVGTSLGKAVESTSSALVKIGVWSPIIGSIGIAQITGGYWRALALTLGMF